ncbi:hypothetical protein FRB91_011782 [Serendipita sp. 411]|nr:hypothetical protein FRC16_010704 [Serendipita sp. 398]KAG8818144.1 hypothetical protein FRC19_010837 [Serendipita sp. 401]KAG8819462.1 hypothetical protein FRC18_012081 [Serendipita sp. 400]KAG8847418.1 hypothetical protein FRB91_011782 [Serendipita sp. 411]
MAYNYHQSAQILPGYMQHSYAAVPQLPQPHSRMTPLRGPMSLANNSPDLSLVNMMDLVDSEDESSEEEEEPIPPQPPVTILRRSSLKSFGSKSKSRERRNSQGRLVPGMVPPHLSVEPSNISHGHPWPTEQVHQLLPPRHVHEAWHHQQPHGFPPYYVPPGSSMAHPQHLSYHPHHYPQPLMPQYMPSEVLETIIPTAPQAVSVATPFQQVCILPEVEMAPKRRQKAKDVPYGESAPNPAWARYALKQPLIDPSTVRAKRLERITLHPLLCSEMCRRLLYFDAIRSPDLGMLKAKGRVDLEDFLSDPACIPRLTTIRLRVEILPHIIALSNPTGVTVENVLSVLKKAIESKLERPIWDGLTNEQRQNVKAFWRRNTTIGYLGNQRAHAINADLLGLHTVLAGLKHLSKDPQLATFEVRWAPDPTANDHARVAHLSL